MKEQTNDNDILPIVAANGAVAYAEGLQDLFFVLFQSAKSQGEPDFFYFRELVLDFGTDLDIVDELKRFHAWCLDSSLNNIRNLRGRFRDWLTRARVYRRVSETATKE